MPRGDLDRQDRDAFVRARRAVGVALAATVAGALLLNGCMTQGCAARHGGAMPRVSPGVTFSLASGDQDRAPPALAAALTRRLTQAGLTATSDRPALLVETVYSERDGRVGAYSELGRKGQPLWLASPARGHWWRPAAPWVRQLAISITDTRTGREVYRSEAVENVRSERGVDWRRLAEDALTGAPFSETPRRGSRCALMGG